MTYCFVHLKYSDFIIGLFELKVERMNVRITKIHFFVEFKNLNSGKNGVICLLFYIVESFLYIGS